MGHSLKGKLPEETRHQRCRIRINNNNIQEMHDIEEGPSALHDRGDSMPEEKRSCSNEERSTIA